MVWEKKNSPSSVVRKSARTLLAVSERVFSVMPSLGTRLSATTMMCAVLVAMCVPDQISASESRTREATGHQD